MEFYEKEWQKLIDEMSREIWFLGENTSQVGESINPSLPKFNKVGDSPKNCQCLTKKR